jgi:hypothetical protein
MKLYGLIIINYNQIFNSDLIYSSLIHFYILINSDNLNCKFIERNKNII